MTEAEDEGELWIGAPAWPAEPPEQWPWEIPRLGLWEGIALDTLQVAGLFCHHQRFYGLKLALRRSDPLTLLARSYQSSHLPGCWNPDHATPLEEIVRVRDRLAELGLVLDPVHYAKFAEAYIPVTAESAWQYALARRLEALVRFPEREIDTPVELHLLGLGDAWEDAALYLTQQWQKVEREQGLGRRWSSVPERWTAVVYYTNSD